MFGRVVKHGQKESQVLCQAVSSFVCLKAICTSGIKLTENDYHLVALGQFLSFGMTACLCIVVGDFKLTVMMFYFPLHSVLIYEGNIKKSSPILFRF